MSNKSSLILGHLVSRFIYFLILLIFTQSSGAQEETTDINLQGQVPRAEFTSTKFNFGDIYRGSIVGHSFSFANTGNGTLVLNSLHATCGCLNIKVFAQDGKTVQSIFKPGENGFIRVEFDSSQFAGNVVRAVTAETNMGSSAPTVTLTLTANVLQELYSNPALLYIGKIDKNTEKIFTLNLQSLSRSNLISSPDIIDSYKEMIQQIDNSNIAKRLRDKILDNHDTIKPLAVESSVPYLEAKLIPTNNPNAQQIQIKVNNSPPIGSLNAKLIVWNNSTYYKNFEIPIVGEVVGQVEASAKYVEFGVVSGQKSSERVISYSSSLKNFSITSVKINLRRLPEMKDLRDSEIFVITKEKLSSRVKFDLDSEVAYQIHFRLVYPRRLNPSQSLDNSSGVNVSGNFLVKTNDPDYKEITVPFFGVLRKGP